jgi:hypothetical protein
MKKYFFYNKKDLNKEVIGFHYCNSLEDALTFFSQIKNLNPKIFLNIFNIEHE